MLQKTGFTRFFGGKSSIKTRKSGFNRFFGGESGIRNRKSGFSGSSKTRIPPLAPITVLTDHVGGEAHDDVLSGVGRGRVVVLLLHVDPRRAGGGGALLVAHSYLEK